jgi:hypothetical protein
MREYGYSARPTTSAHRKAWKRARKSPTGVETKTKTAASQKRGRKWGGVLQRSSQKKERCVKKIGAFSKHKTTRRWSQKLQIETRWSDTTQRIQLLKQSAEFIDNNQGKGIVAADIHQHLGLHARKVNEIFLRFYGVSARTNLREYKCKVLFVQILLAPKNLQEDHYPAAGMTGSPGEKRAFKSLYGVSVDDHWSRSQAESSRDHAREGPHPSLPNALLDAEETIQKLMATITEPTANGEKPRGT